jgi:two-component system, cell cycle sensor histidine kinase and response regulator CckA
VLQAFLIVGLVTNRIRRIKAERVLRQSERRYRAFFEEGPDGVVILNPETGKLIEFNDQVCRQLGYTREEFARLSLRDIEVSETAEEIQAHIRKVLREGRDDFEARHRTKQGEIRHVRVTAQLIDAERRSFYHCIWRDITERMRAEEARRLNESRLETLLRLNQMTGATLHEITEFAMEEAVRLTQSTIGYVAFMNEDETVLTMHAWSRAAMHECRIDDKPLDYPVETTGLWGEAARQRRPVITNDYQTPNPLKRGTPQGHVAVTRHMNAPVFDGERIVIVAGVGNKPTDYDEADTRQLTLLMTGMWHIVQRKRDEEALRTSEEKYRQVVENANDAIFIAQDGFIKFPNPRLSVISGYSQEELTQKPFLEFVHPDDRELVATTYQRRLQGEDVPHTYSFRTVDKPGNTVWAELSSVLLNWEGRPASLNFFRDITAEKKLESRLVQAQKMEAVATLAGGIAHDFNNLLQAVQGYAELLLLPKGKGEPGFRELQEISRAAKRGGELTRQLLTFSRKVESKLQPVDLNRIVEDVRLLLERTIPKMIKMELHLTGNLHPVNADASQIEQILMNLAVNARDAMPDGGTLSVETRNVILDEEVRRSQPELTPGNYVLLAVADTGQGMDKATLKNIFDPFFTTKEVGKGTGLGLAMVYGIVKNHHGHIVCASQPGQGTVFEIYLPAVVKIEKTPAAVTGTHRLRGGNETILLVDDDASLRNLGEQILRFHGYTVTSAQDGEKALQIYKDCKGRIDLIVLDLSMPGMGGALCLQRLLEMNPEAKVVIASGYSVSGETEKATKSGAKAFVQKPYDVQQMIEVVREVLDE